MSLPAIHSIQEDSPGRLGCERTFRGPVKLPTALPSGSDSNENENDFVTKFQQLDRAIKANSARPSLVLPQMNNSCARESRRRSDARPSFASVETIVTAATAKTTTTKATLLSATMIPDILACGVKDLPDMSPAQTTDVNISFGIRDYNAAQYIASLSRLNRAIEKRPRVFLPRFVRGLCYDKLQQSDLSLRDFSLCCNDDQTDCSNEYDRTLAFFNRGVIKTKLSMHGALEDYTTAISIFGFDPDFYANRALLQRRLGNFEAAQQDYKMLRRIKDGFNHAANIPSSSGSPTRSSNSMGRRTATCSIRGDPKLLMRKSPKARQARKRPKSELDLKANIYGQVHGALTCPAQERTAAQINILVKESKMMPAFAQLDANQLYLLWQYLEYRMCASNVRIFDQGDPADDFYIVWSGCVSARVRKENSTITHANVARALALETEFTVNTMVAGEALGDAVLDVGGIRRASCVTDEKTELLVLRKQHFDKTFKVFLERAHEEKLNFLSRIECFAKWDRQKLGAMANFIREKKYRAGQVIARQESAADSIFFIKSGLVSILRTIQVGSSEENDASSSCDICVAKLSGGDLFGETTILGQQEHGSKAFPSSVLCETYTVCYRLDKVQIDHNDWDDDTRASLKAASVVYPDDSLLLQSHVDDVKFKREKKLIMRRLKKQCKKRQRHDR